MVNSNFSTALWEETGQIGLTGAKPPDHWLLETVASMAFEPVDWYLAARDVADMLAGRLPVNALTVGGVALTFLPLIPSKPVRRAGRMVDAPIGTLDNIPTNRLVFHHRGS